MEDNNTFNKIIKASLKLPVVQIDRESFLRKELSPYYEEETIQKVLKSGTKGIVDKKIVDKIAKGCINYETSVVCSVSALAGLPGGWAMAGAIPADIAQFYAHVMALTQKILYIYGWPDLTDENGNVNDDTAQIMILFIGLMMGAQGAEAAIKTLLKAFSEQVEKRIAKVALAKYGIYQVAKQVCKWIGIKLTRDGFAKALGKIIPIIGAPISAGVTYFTFKPMADKLLKEMNKEWQEMKSN